ncbi:MAG: rod shape-determining protein RodA [Candidatus Aminicenantes bacterium]|nr:MAG: rod shape-determining protein RodA [Candidatus Aminicenantes bacterium]
MKDVLKYFDKFTFAVLVCLTIFGIILIFSASSGMNQAYWAKQLLWLFFSLIAFFVIFRIKTEKVFQFALAFYVMLTVILAMQILAGEIISGAKSWIKTGFFYIQVSEFIKIPLALYLAKTLTRMSTIRWKDFFKLVVLVGCPFLLIARQPDLGTAFILVSFLITAILLKGIRPIIVVFSLMVLVLGSVTIWNYVLRPYQRDRIIAYLNPEKYEKSTGYQIIQSKIAIGSGGLTGKGYLRGTQSQYKFLPTRHTDFIASVLGEEFGFLGISFLFLLFFILFYRQFHVQTESDEEFYFIYLFNGIILFQFLINIFMAIGFVPVLGIPLPFVSYGGSSLLAFFIGEALIFRMKINTYLNEF